MANKTQKSDAVIDEVSIQLRNLSDVVKLAAFAAEARRTLLEIDRVANHLPDLGALLDRLVEARAEWTTHNDDLGGTLRSTAHQIDALQRRLEALL